jgi:hypothetical protein
MENTKLSTNLDATTCTGSGTTGHKEAEYNNIGFSPCAEYVAHKSDTPCNVLNDKPVIEVSKDPHECQCRTDSCPCGDFLSHKISEPCTVKV